MENQEGRLNIGYTQEQKTQKVENKFSIKNIKESLVSMFKGKDFSIHRAAQKPERDSGQSIKRVNEYNQPATEKEISQFQKGIKESIEKKAEILSISREKLIELADLDLESLELEKLKAFNLSHGSMEFLKDSINESINEVSKDGKTNTLLKENPSRFLEFIKNHKSKISLAQLGLYLSVFGSPVLKDLSMGNIQIDSDGKNLPPEDLAKNPDLLKKIQESADKHLKNGVGKEIPSAKITEIYEKTKDLPKNEIKYENINSTIKEVDNYFKYAELIKNGEKENLDGVVDNLVHNNNDVILLGEWHGPDSNAINSAKILEKISDKNKTIAKIAFEFLSIDDPETIKIVEKFNKKEISAEDFHYKSNVLFGRSNIMPLLEFAQKHDIPITGIENGNSSKSPWSGEDVSRFTNISHNIGEISKEKKSDEIVVVFIGQKHTTESNFGLDSTQTSAYKEGRKDAREKDYTIKEYLEKSGFNPAAINIDEWSKVAGASDGYLENAYKKTDPKDKESLEDYVNKNWGNYKMEQKEVFAVKHTGDKNVYSVINPSKAPENPPQFNTLKTIKENYSQLDKVIEGDASATYYNDELIVHYDNKNLVVAKTNPDTGKIEEVFLPQGDYNKSVVEKMKNFDKFASEEKTREILTAYDPNLHRKEQSIKK